MPLSQASQYLLDQVREYLEECDEANALLNYADRARVPIQWGRGRSLRDVLRDARARERKTGE